MKRFHYCKKTKKLKMVKVKKDEEMTDIELVQIVTNTELDDEGVNEIIRNVEKKYPGIPLLDLKPDDLCMEAYLVENKDKVSKMTDIELVQVLTRTKLKDEVAKEIIRNVEKKYPGIPLLDLNIHDLYTEACLVKNAQKKKKG